jgi:hypothetical protein
MFITGYDSLQTQVDRKQKEYERRNKPFRFYLQRPGDQAEVTFLDEPKQAVHEHKVFQVGQPMQIFTCPKLNFNQPCPFCAAGLLTSFSFFFTVIDHRPYEGKDQKRLLIANEDLTKSLMMISQQNGGLLNKRLLIMRGQQQKSSTSGNSAQLAMRDMRPLQTDFQMYLRQPYPQDFLKPFDYVKVFDVEDFETLDYWAKIGVQARDAAKKQKRGQIHGQGQSSYQGQGGYSQPSYPVHNGQPSGQGFVVQPNAHQPPPQIQPQYPPQGYQQPPQQPYYPPQQQPVQPPYPQYAQSPAFAQGPVTGVPLHGQQNEENLPDIPF